MERSGDATCSFCGRSLHPRSECPARASLCNHCRKKGHFAEVCSSRKAKPTKLAATRLDTGVVPENTKYVDVTVDNYTASFKVDSDAEVSAVPEGFPTVPPQLDKVDNQLTAPGSQPLRVLGSYVAQFLWKGKTSAQRLYAVQSLSTPLLGFPALQALDGVRFLGGVGTPPPQHHAELFKGFGMQYLPGKLLATVSAVSRIPPKVSSPLNTVELFATEVIKNASSTLPLTRQDIERAQSMDGAASIRVLEAVGGSEDGSVVRTRSGRRVVPIIIISFRGLSSRASSSRVPRDCKRTVCKRKERGTLPKASACENFSHRPSSFFFACLHLHVPRPAPPAMWTTAELLPRSAFPGGGVEGYDLNAVRSVRFLEARSTRLQANFATTDVRACVVEQVYLARVWDQVFSTIVDALKSSDRRRYETSAAERDVDRSDGNGAQITFGTVDLDFVEVFRISASRRRETCPVYTLRGVPSGRPNHYANSPSTGYLQRHPGLSAVTLSRRGLRLREPRVQPPRMTRREQALFGGSFASIQRRNTGPPSASPQRRHVDNQVRPGRVVARIRGTRRALKVRVSEEATECEVVPVKVLALGCLLGYNTFVAHFDSASVCFHLRCVPRVFRVFVNVVVPRRGMLSDAVRRRRPEGPRLAPVLSIGTTTRPRSQPPRSGRTAARSRGGESGYRLLGPGRGRSSRRPCHCLCLLKR
ncbi:hypothetical protein HPB49_016712 [Dermacentor silvarum]|uniref:Uncharacterized protein n=1 Tax=Dermacentor silvarum TaxID=543639 RepID=A0ACB8DK13_DERSI|nr:hypothetical protein HPB49_016712 [Dermacentor silvarum]